MGSKKKLSEHLGKIECVKDLCPGIEFYGESYNRYDMFGNECSMPEGTIRNSFLNKWN